MKTVGLIILMVMGLFNRADAESTITLKSGETLQGEVLSDTNGVVQMRVFSHNRTISSLRDISRADIQIIRLETAAESAERSDYFALSKFQLNPDEEQSVGWYNQWVAAFERFLDNYPKSDKTTIVQQRIQDCRSELRYIAAGQVKFENIWMTPVEKKPKAFEKQLTSLQTQRDSLAVWVGGKQAELAGLQMRLSGLQDTQEPIYYTSTDNPHHYAERRPVTDAYGHQQLQTVPNPERGPITAGITSVMREISTGQEKLHVLDSKIESIKTQIPQAQRAYEVFLAKDNRQPVQALAAPPAPASPPPPPSMQLSR